MMMIMRYEIMIIKRYEMITRYEIMMIKRYGNDDGDDNEV